MSRFDPLLGAQHHHVTTAESAALGPDTVFGGTFNPMGTMGLIYGGANGGYNVGAGEFINAWTEGGKKPQDL